MDFNIFDYVSYNSVVILSYFFICLAVLVLDRITKGKVNNFFVCRRGNVFNPMNFFRLFLSGVCHCDWMHFRNNFLTILLLGPMLEEKYGSMNILYMLLITTAVSSLVHLFIYDGGAIGASDNVFMMVVLCSIVNISSGKIPLTLLFILMFYVFDEIVKLFSSKGDHIAHDSHIVGAVCGFIFGYFIF